ncbi:hypothetical protein OAG1_39570 [Agarivorans sp. OAG1]|uniref:Outer membrane protein beta-barrel domain-containing protein n=1 Tax=Agarivorans albus MKT 106 TaxID=1331007 RepID=R9PPX2_AGAAL|nr:MULTISPECIES: hypothetical protein [Agarivorans]MPW29727.1 hypothetical protein [Agarivorans sp. B2Z047]UQN43294.1 hypothetical protein LQZ07_02145 [Agarivorans sp. B2Z047]BEU05157.1 hypothetical protein OAG1_39570 [Agarivorans sp. OAG1]GAD03345.1 hypothetical protein AALB_3425 [Agarivorans albus MKT 106]
MKIAVFGAGALCLVAFSSNANPELGVMVGSDNGISAQFNDIRVNLGLNDFSLSGDKIIGFPEQQYFYYGFGGKWSDHHHHKLGARAVFGAHTVVDKFRFFAELQPIVYVIDDLEVKLEASAGVRYMF